MDDRGEYRTEMSPDEDPTASWLIRGCHKTRIMDCSPTEIRRSSSRVALEKQTT